MVLLLFLLTLVDLSVAQAPSTNYCVCDESCFTQKILPRILMKPTTDALLGYNDTMEELINLLIKPVEQPDDYYGLLGSRRGLLLFGPPGTGKTFSMETLAGRLEKLGIQMWKLQYADMWETAYVGEGQTKMKCYFDRAEEAKRQGKILLLFDEGETLFKARGKDNDQHAQEVITVALNRISPKAPFRTILITNLPQDVDFAIRRRMGNQFCYRLPTAEERYQMFCNKLSERGVGPGWKVAQDFDVAHFKQATEYFAGDDIQRLCERLANTKARNSTGTPLRQKTTPITTADIKEALKAIRPVSSAEELKQYAYYSEKYSNPCFHELIPKKRNNVPDLGRMAFEMKETAAGTSGRYRNIDIEEAVAKRAALETYEGACLQVQEEQPLGLEFWIPVGLLCGIATIVIIVLAAKFNPAASSTSPRPSIDQLDSENDLRSALLENMENLGQ